MEFTSCYFFAGHFQNAMMDFIRQSSNAEAFQTAVTFLGIRPVIKH